MLRTLLDRFVPFARGRGARADSMQEADRLIALGDEAGRAGDLHGACERYREAVAAAPGYARGQLNLGTGLEALGDADGAIRSYEAALALDAANAHASYNLGRLLYLRGAVERAGELLRSALRHKPGFPEALVALSSVHESQGDLAAAAAALEAVLEARKDWVGALLNYAGVLKKLGRFGEAEATLRRVVAIEPLNADALYDLANLLYARRALDEAEQLLRLALEHKPQFPEGWFLLSSVYDSRGELDAAAAAMEMVLTQRPDWTVALNDYGIILQKLQKLSDAEAVLRRAIAVDSRFRPAYQNLGAVLVNQCRIAEAINIFHMGTTIAPEDFDLESAELFALNLWDEISSDELFARHKAFGERLEMAHRPRFQPFQNEADPERRLRVGYVSGDFCSHSVGLFMIPLIERHDRSAFEVYCYSVGTMVDDFTRLLQSKADNWREAAAMAHAELADTIHRDGIDILVDLSGHSGQSRLVAFAQQPAPVQVSWLGYLSTTGTSRLQYRLCDRYTDPDGAEQLHTETLIRLPNSQWCYRPRASIDYTFSSTPPCRNNGFITFGSFNNIPKISQSARRLWCEILAHVPESRLIVIGVPDGHARDALVEYFRSEGVQEDRVSVVPRVPIHEYFRTFDAVDIALDTTPYSGGTTTCDCLWMGVPVITVTGSRPVSRSAGGILSVVGLREWIASTPQDYVQLAVRFSRDYDLVSSLRKTLRERMQNSPIMDEVRFARDIEATYRSMWRAWCSGAKSI